MGLPMYSVHAHAPAHARSPRRYDSSVCTLASLSKSEIWLDLASSCTTRRAPAAAYAYVLRTLLMPAHTKVGESTYSRTGPELCQVSSSL